MKRVMVLSTMALVILLSSAAIQADDTQRIGATTRKAKGMSEKEKQWREKLKAMTPEQRQLEMAQKAMEKELAPWQAVRKIAAEEKAEKTVAAIDTVIAAKEAQFKKKLEAMEKRKAVSADKPKRKAASADKPKRKAASADKPKKKAASADKPNKKRPEGEKPKKKKNKAETEG